MGWVAESGNGAAFFHSAQLQSVKIIKKSDHLGGELAVLLRKLVHLPPPIRLPDNGQFKEHYSLVTDTLRIYLETQHRIPATDRTTSELKQELAYTRVDPEQTRVLINLFSDADFVKFAKLIPDRDDAYHLLEDAGLFVKATRPRPESTEKGQSPKSLNTTTPVEVSR